MHGTGTQCVVQAGGGKRPALGAAVCMQAPSGASLLLPPRGRGPGEGRHTFLPRRANEYAAAAAMQLSPSTATSAALLSTRFLEAAASAMGRVERLPPLSSGCRAKMAKIFQVAGLERCGRAAQPARLGPCNTEYDVVHGTAERSRPGMEGGHIAAGPLPAGRQAASAATPCGTASRCRLGTRAVAAVWLLNGWRGSPSWTVICLVSCLVNHCNFKASRMREDGPLHWLGAA